MNGLLLVQKPSGMRSHALVLKVRRLLQRFVPKIKVGHTGTLDAFATGLMILPVGKATKATQYLQGLDKEYICLARLGISTDTYDRLGKVLSQSSLEGLNSSQILQALKGFVGTYPQMPPPFSAKKIMGKPAYLWVRRGKTPPLKPKTITVYSVQVEEISLPFVRFFIHCSSGTYIRSVVYELGQKLGCGAMVQELERTKIGPFQGGLLLEKLEEIASRSREEVEQCLLPVPEYFKKRRKV